MKLIAALLLVLGFIPQGRTLVSFKADGKLYSTADYEIKDGKAVVPGLVEISFEQREPQQAEYEGIIVFRNLKETDLVIENVVPFGEERNSVYITGLGKHGLSRAHLFRPGYEAVNVILPDNAWELGYSSAALGGDVGIAALTRRGQVKDGRRGRFETTLKAGGSVEYRLWAERYKGEWQEGLRTMFQKHYLFDIKDGKFDDSLFERKDLEWIRHSYALHTIMAWNHIFYEDDSLENFLKKYKKLIGGNEAISIWPNWPMLGLDQRNQWDMFRSLPGGTAKLREMAELSRSYGSRFFISYNPWDDATRNEDHHAGMAAMVGEISADGVILDCEGKSSLEHQNAADSRRAGVIMYSEGMAVPRDMQGIVSGRVHNALYYPPMLNLNKLIKPEFAIFRVAEQYSEPIRREYNLSFFNGYGTEVNIFRPGWPDWVEEQQLYFARTLMILRSNTVNFTNKGYTPLIPTLLDRVYVNYWPGETKDVYTILSLLPEGVYEPLFEVSAPAEDEHYFDLWNNCEARLENIEGKTYVAADIEAFSKKYSGSNNEGAIGAVAKFKSLIKKELNGCELELSASCGSYIKLWAGEPEYISEEQSCRKFGIEKKSIDLYKTFGRYQGKFVIQLFDDKDQLLDSRIAETVPGEPMLISKSCKTVLYDKAPENMVLIPAGKLLMKTTYGDNFVPTPMFGGKEMEFGSYYMDKYPVTNREFKKFMDESGYAPADKSNFLKHWVNGAPAAGEEDFPVIYVSYDDARAYCEWAGKRLPTEAEWQYAAQTEKGWDWPWGDKIKVIKKDIEVTATLTVTQLQVPKGYCNVGDNQLYKVGKYRKGANPNGLYDLVGSVWQLTADRYDNGSNFINIVKGGSYFLPASSWWYVEGGPRELTYCQKILSVSPGFDRCATVGFRCVADTKND